MFGIRVCLLGVMLSSVSSMSYLFFFEYSLTRVICCVNMVYICKCRLQGMRNQISRVGTLSAKDDVQGHQQHIRDVNSASSRHLYHGTRDAVSLPTQTFAASSTPRDSCRANPTGAANGTGGGDSAMSWDQLHIREGSSTSFDEVYDPSEVAGKQQGRQERGRECVRDWGKDGMTQVDEMGPSAHGPRVGQEKTGWEGGSRREAKNRIEELTHELIESQAEVLVLKRQVRAQGGGTAHDCLNALSHTMDKRREQMSEIVLQYETRTSNMSLQLQHSALELQHSALELQRVSAQRDAAETQRDAALARAADIRGTRTNFGKVSLLIQFAI